MKKILTLFAMVITTAAAAQRVQFFASINKFTAINDYMAANFDPLVNKYIYTSADLQKLEEISKHLDNYSEDPSLGPDYYGYVKTCVANYYYMAASLVQRSRGFYDNRQLKDFTLNYLHKSIATETSYNHLAFSNTLKLTTVTNVEVDMKTGQLITSNTTGTHSVKPLFIRSYKNMAFIQESDNMPDSALANYLRWIDMGHEWWAVDHFTKEELSDVLTDMNRMAAKAHSFSQEYMRFCLLSLLAPAIKDQWDAPLSAIDKEVIQKIYRLVDLAVASSGDIKYSGSLAPESALNRLDYATMVTPFYKLDKAGKLSQTDRTPKSLFTDCFYILKTRTLGTNINQMLETLVKDCFTAYMQYWFKEKTEYQKKQLSQWDYGNLLWYRALAQQYPIDEEALKLLEERIKYCSKKFKKDGPRAVYYKEQLMYMPDQYK